MPENDKIMNEEFVELDSLETLKNTQGKIMAVDFGDTRTGLAVSDTSRFLASGIGYVSPGGIEKTAETVAEAAKEQRAVAVVVGLPVNMDGSQGSRAERCKKFARMVKEQTGLTVAMFDERMTTMTASRYLNETNTRGKKRKGVIDTLSAQIILQNCLDRLKYMN
jgi:putative Holliday junction resolvase